jgi:acyl-coenzyme A synthetase/AMP-(fatty) acid ligase
VITDSQLRTAELEDLLIQHPYVDDAAVIGVNDDIQATEVPMGYSAYDRFNIMMYAE